MKALFITITLLFLSSCGEHQHNLTVTLDEGNVYLNSDVVTDLEHELKIVSCVNEEKVVLRAKKGVSFYMLERVLKQISNAGCKENLVLKKI